MVAKNLLWMFVVINSCNIIVSFVSEEERSIEMLVGIWIAVSVLAICEAIEKNIEIYRGKNK